MFRCMPLGIKSSSMSKPQSAITESRGSYKSMILQHLVSSLSDIDSG